MTKRSSTSAAAKKAETAAKTAETPQAAAAAVEVKETEQEVAEMKAEADANDAPEPTTGDPVPFDEQAPAESVAQSVAQEQAQGGDAHPVHADGEDSEAGRLVGVTPHRSDYAPPASTKGQPVGGNGNHLGADPTDATSVKGQEVGGTGNVRLDADELERSDSAAGQPIGGNVNVRVPAAGSLDAPEAPAAAADGPTGVLPVSSGEVGIESASEKPHDMIVNALNGQAPDADDMFTEADGPGNMMVSKYRLAQIKNPGEGWSSSKLLIMPAGQYVSKDRAEQLVAVVRAQAEAAASE